MILLLMHKNVDDVKKDVSNALSVLDGEQECPLKRPERSVVDSVSVDWTAGRGQYNLLL